MDHYIACLGLISCLVIGTLAVQNVTVSVSGDLKVKPTPDPLLDPKDRVSVTLECTGSSAELSFYIKNRMEWKFFGSDKKVKGITQSFYPYPKSEYAARNFASGHFTNSYQQNDNHQYVFSIVIVGVTAADNGIYQCSLVSESSFITDSKEVQLVVVNPVTAVSMELHDTSHNLVVQSNSKLAQDEQPIEITPGQYMVSCSASGSNPEPMMELFYNADRLSVSAHTETDSSTDVMSYKGSFPMTPLTITAQTSIQSLTCRANIAGGYYKAQEAALALMVQVNKPNVKCENASATNTDRHTNLKCVISSPGNNNALECHKVSWLLSNKGVHITYDQRWKDPENKYDIMEGKCQKGADGLTVHLDLYKTTDAIFAETFFLVYGTGQNAHRHAIILHDVTVAAAGAVTPLSLLVSLIIALVSKQLANL